MRALHAKRTVLVPVFGGDISDEAYAAASSLLEHRGSRLVLLHVAPAAEGATGSPVPRKSADAEPRWHRLASAAEPDHTFVEAVVGDPVDEVLAEADRFHSDVIVLGPPAAPGPADAWIDRAITRLAHAAPRRVCVATRRARPTTHLAAFGASRALH